jgi:hypothetical protein
MEQEETVEVDVGRIETDTLGRNESLPRILRLGRCFYCCDTGHWSVDTIILAAPSRGISHPSREMLPCLDCHGR